MARKLRERLSEIVPVLDLLVFGSRARGEATPESDLDVFIVVDRVTQKQRRRISEVAWELNLEAGLVISTIVASRDQLAHGAMGANPPVTMVQQEGVRP